MRTNSSLRMHFGLAVLLSLVISVSPLLAQGTRGGAPRGGGAPAQNDGTAANRGGNRGADTAQARQQIQAAKKAAIDQANSMYRLAMVTAQADAKSSDAGTRAQSKSEAQIAQSNRKAAIDRANANAQAALASLNSR